MPRRSRELLHHAVVGGVVVMLLATFHEATEVWINRAKTADSTWGHVLLIWTAFIFTAFAAGFAGTLWLDNYLAKKRWKAPILLDDVENVQGTWIDAIVQNGTITAGSIIEITSSQGQGFTVLGRTFAVNNGEVGLTDEPNTFEGHGGSVFARNGISFGYKGVVVQQQNQPRSEHFGVVYYQFFRVRNDVRPYFVGAFLAREEQTVSHVVGKGLPPDLQDSEKKNFLKLWLQGDFQAFLPSLPADLGRHIRVATPANNH